MFNQKCLAKTHAKLYPFSETLLSFFKISATGLSAGAARTAIKHNARQIKSFIMTTVKEKELSLLVEEFKNTVNL